MSSKVSICYYFNKRDYWLYCYFIECSPTLKKVVNNNDEIININKRKSELNQEYSKLIDEEDEYKADKESDGSFSRANSSLNSNSQSARHILQKVISSKFENHGIKPIDLNKKASLKIANSFSTISDPSNLSVNPEEQNYKGAEAEKRPSQCNELLDKFIKRTQKNKMSEKS